MAKQHDSLTRRAFTRQSVLALFAGVTVTLSGCGDDTPNAPTAADKSGTVADNHGHAATITAAVQSGGGSVTLNIQGQATHNHQVLLTAAQVVQVRDNRPVSVTSTTTDAHQHTITFN